MGERLLCKQEVIGSIPFTSTTAQCASRIVASRGRHNAVVPRAARCGKRRGGDWRLAASPHGAAFAAPERG